MKYKFKNRKRNGPTQFTYEITCDGKHVGILFDNLASTKEKPRFCVFLNSAGAGQYIESAHTIEEAKTITRKLHQNMLYNHNRSVSEILKHIRDNEHKVKNLIKYNEPPNTPMQCDMIGRNKEVFLAGDSAYFTLQDYVTLLALNQIEYKGYQLVDPRPLIITVSGGKKFETLGMCKWVRSGDTMYVSGMNGRHTLASFSVKEVINHDTV